MFPETVDSLDCSDSKAAQGYCNMAAGEEGDILDHNLVEVAQKEHCHTWAEDQTVLPWLSV